MKRINQHALRSHDNTKRIEIRRITKTTSWSRATRIDSANSPPRTTRSHDVFKVDYLKATQLVHLTMLVRTQMSFAQCLDIERSHQDYQHSALLLYSWFESMARACVCVVIRDRFASNIGALLVKLMLCVYLHTVLRDRVYIVGIVLNIT